MSFDVVKNRVCDELDTWVLEPEFLDLFGFVVNMGWWGWQRRRFH